MKVVLVWYMADFVAWNCLHITNNLRAPLNEIIYIYFLGGLLHLGFSFFEIFAMLGSSNTHDSLDFSTN